MFLFLTIFAKVISYHIEKRGFIWPKTFEKNKTNLF